MSAANIKAEELSAAKRESSKNAEILGKQQRGGILMRDEKPYALKHDIYRFTANPNRPWGHPDYGYTKSDLVPIHMFLDLPTHEQTLGAANRYLNEWMEGRVPLEATQGVELEGAVYKRGTTQLAPAYTNPKTNAHPELMETTLETATGANPDGSYPTDMVSIARHIAQGILESHEVAEQNGNVVVHTSVPEGGSPFENRNTPIPYLQAFAPRVLADTLAHGENIPPQVIEYYKKIGIGDIQSYLRDSGILNWPVNALHVHNGVPMIDGLGDTRAAFAMAQIRNTEMAKILSFMLYNTAYCYGQDANTKDGRSIMRRLLSTAHGGNLPQSAEDYVHGAVVALEEGDIHSLARYPKHSQHDRTRIRMDGITMESIDAPMNPDLRLVLGWTYINQIMNVIALDALNKTNGDESRVSKQLQEMYGEIMSPISALGEERSSFAHDLIFNKEGFNGKAPWMQDSYRGILSKIVQVFETFANDYPGLRNYVTIVNSLIQNVGNPSGNQSLAEYMGIENGAYQPNGKNIGIITDAKKGLEVHELIDIQSKGTKLQAEALMRVQGDEDLLAFFGIS